MGRKGSKENNVVEKRGEWSNSAEFILCCLGYAVGLGNIWRFPYMCYENGGGAFLIPYAIMLMFVGIPAFFMELIMGQYSGRGPLHVWEAVPILRGIGLGSLFITCMICIFYTMIMGYALYYLVLSFYNPLPWDNCQNEFNTPYCYAKSEAVVCEAIDNGTWFNNTCYNATYVYTQGSDEQYCNATSCFPYRLNIFEETLSNLTDKSVSSSEEFFNHGVLQMSPGIEHTGRMIWQLVCALGAGWAICYLCLIKGIKTTGKVVYFTALFPYVVLTILLIYACTLPGSYDGIIFYLKPDWQKLKTSKVWVDAASQIFFSLSVGAGGLMTFASYNKFNNNVYRDALIVSIGNCLTSFYAGFAIFSILGYMANILGKDVSEVVVDGSTLAFVAYPTTVAIMPVPQLWAVLFFFMLITLALDSLFAGVETLITAIVDSAPSARRHKSWITLVICIIFFILGLPMTTQAGVYWLNIIAYYATGWSLLIVGVLETTGFAWFYGAKKIRAHVKEMCGFSIGIHWWILWTIITPLVLIAILVFAAIDFKPLAFGPYELPPNYQLIGWLVALTPVATLLLYMIVAFCRLCRSDDCASLTHRQRLSKLFKPSDKWGPSYKTEEALMNGGVNTNSEKGDVYTVQGSQGSIDKTWNEPPEIDHHTVNSVHHKTDNPVFTDYTNSAYEYTDRL